MATLDANALNIVDFGKMSNDPKIEGVTWALVRHNAVLQDIPFFNKQSLKAAGVRWEGDLPNTDWVKLNEGGPTVTGAPTQFAEQAFIMRNMIKTDTALIDDENTIGDPHVQRIDAYIRGRSHDFNDVFINNSPEVNPNAIVGLRYRLDNPNTFKVSSDHKITAGGTLTLAATAQNFIEHQEKLDEMLDAVDSPDGSGVTIYCNGTYYRRFASLSKKYSGQGGFSTASDQYGRDVYRYKNAILRDVGRKSDQTTQIITGTETSTGADGSSDYTSIYAVNYSPMNFAGWMFRMQAKDVPQDDGVLKATFLEMICGLYPQTHRCFARMVGIKIK